MIIAVELNALIEENNLLERLSSEIYRNQFVYREQKFQWKNQCLNQEQTFQRKKTALVLRTIISKVQTEPFTLKEAKGIEEQRAKKGKNTFFVSMPLLIYLMK